MKQAYFQIMKINIRFSIGRHALSILEKADMSILLDLVIGYMHSLDYASFSSYIFKHHSQIFLWRDRNRSPRHVSSFITLVISPILQLGKTNLHVLKHDICYWSHGSTEWSSSLLFLFPVSSSFIAFWGQNPYTAQKSSCCSVSASAKFLMDKVWD